MSSDTEKIIASYRTMLLSERRRTAELRARLRRAERLMAVAVVLSAALGIALTMWLLR